MRGQCAEHKVSLGGIHMTKINQLAAVILAVSLLVVLSPCALLQGVQAAVPAHAAGNERAAADNVLYVQKVVKGTNARYWDNYDVKFKFKASVKVEYDHNLGKYIMTNVLTEFPKAVIRRSSGTQAIWTEPTWQYTDGGRTIVLSSQATVQNKTGYAAPIDIHMFIYCNGHTGAVRMDAY